MIIAIKYDLSGQPMKKPLMVLALSFFSCGLYTLISVEHPKCEDASN